MRQLRFWQRHSHWQECEDWIPLRAGTTVEARQRRRLLLDIVKTKFCIMYVNLQQPEIYATPRHATGDKIWEEKSREERPSIKYISSDKLIRPASGPPLIFVQLPREAGKARK